MDIRQEESCIGCEMNLPLVKVMGELMHKYKRFVYWECCKKESQLTEGGSSV